MILKTNTPIIGMYIQSIPITKVYLSKYLVWEPEKDNPALEILSCYYNGYWVDEYPWTDETSWTD